VEGVQCEGAVRGLAEGRRVERVGGRQDGGLRGGPALGPAAVWQWWLVAVCEQSVGQELAGQCKVLADGET